ncbi:tetratricopeptide repeat protein [Providencia sp. Me31A]|uniref:tetratricopeptide repeat protein n=1 Tax=Providencia sp. Me31A TaxID=3392637 RepID=UPI003D2DD353
MVANFNKTVITLFFSLLSLQSVAQFDLTPEDKHLFAQRKQQAVNKDAQSQYELAEMYFTGKGVLQNVNSARLWANEAAKSGNADGYALLADISLFNDSYFKHEFIDARKYATKAVELGSIKGKISLATSLINPIGGQTDYVQAIKLLDEIVALNNPEYVNAPILLGIIYMDGKGVPKDEEKALQWFDKANELTYPGYGQWMAAFWFSEDNTGTVTIDQEKAKKLRLLACEEGKKAGSEMFCLSD